MTVADMPEPLVPAEVDLRDFPFMPLDVMRLRDSDFSALSSGDEFKAAILLWCYAWHQVPAGSVPNDHRLLAKHSGAGKAWEKVADEALRGFVQCSDGRLYHPVIAEKALEAWDKRTSASRKGKAGAAARWSRGQCSSNATAIAQALPAPMPKNGKGQGQGQGQGEYISPNGDMSGKPDAASLFASSPSESKTKRRAETEAALRILEFLNEKTGRAYKPVKSNIALIVARLREGHDEDICRAVIARKFREWNTDAKMAPYLRPATLFNAQKFNQYAGECVQ